jgi:hypothetical protein
VKRVESNVRHDTSDHRIKSDLMVVEMLLFCSIEIHTGNE